MGSVENSWKACKCAPTLYCRAHRHLGISCNIMIGWQVLRRGWAVRKGSLLLVGSCCKVTLCKGDIAPDVNIVDEDVVEVAALLVAKEGVRHPNLHKSSMILLCLDFERKTFFGSVIVRYFILPPTESNLRLNKKQCS